MSKALSSQGVLAASLLAVSLVISYPLTATAQLKLSRMVWDFESVEQGESKTQKLVLTNSGDQPLTVEKVELPEGCSIKPDLANKEIQAKEDVEVEFTFDSQGLLGKLQQYAYLILSDSTIVPLTIKGEVFAKALPRLQVTPTTWDFGTVKVGENRQRPFRCKNAGTADLKIEKVQIYDSKFRVLRNITKEILPPGEEVDFAISVNPTYAGKCETDFYVKSDSAGRKYTKISIKGYAVSKTVGVVVSSDLSSFENNTPYKVELTRTDGQGKEEALTVERDSRKSFPREPGAERTPPKDYTLTIKVVRPSRPTPAPKPAETKAPGKEPGPVAPKPLTEPTGETAPPAETQPGEAEGSPAPGKPEEKPDQPKEEGETTAPEKTEPETSPQEPPAEPDEEKPSEGEAPPKEETTPAKPGEAESPEAPEKKEETAPEKPEAEKEAAPTPDKEDTEKPPAESKKDESSEKPASPPAPEPAGSPSSPESPEKPSGEGPSANR